MAGAEGVAPSFAVLETAVLLLNYAPIKKIIIGVSVALARRGCRNRTHACAFGERRTTTIRTPHGSLIADGKSLLVCR